jgi:hypothetical protein
MKKASLNNSHFKKAFTLKIERDAMKTYSCSIVCDACGFEKLYLIRVMRHACGDIYPRFQGISRIIKFGILFL